jgi:alkylation response protein AidB-like acyl-CoA dehydrogenase
VPHCEQWESDEWIPRSVFESAGRRGLLGLTAPIEWGGQGLSQEAYARIIQEIARHHASLAIDLAVHNTLGVGHLLRHGTEQQKRRFLPGLIRGELLSAWALTEANAGSDSSALQTAARPSSGGWTIDGRKTFITGGSRADLLVVIAKSGLTEAGKAEMSAFLVLGENVRRLRRIRTYGMRASDTAEICLDGAPAELLGERGNGQRDGLGLLDRGRIGVAMVGIGVARAATEAAARYGIQREQFGKPLTDHQAIQWMLADSATELDAAELLTLRAATLQDQGLDTNRESAMAKLFASEAATRACNRALQIHGGRGYTLDCPVERFLRDVKLCEIAEGTSEIQRMIIARHVVRSTRKDMADEPAPVIIREARAGEAPQIAALFRQTYQESSHPCKDPDFVAKTFASNDERWFVGAVGDRIVACTSSIRHAWNGVYECCRSVTLTEFRGSGLGKRLYAKCLEETCVRRNCDRTISNPRSWAMFRLMSRDIHPATVLLGHDGAMNVANGQREFHLVGMTSSGHGPLRHVIPAGSKIATDPFVADEILRPLNVVSQVGEYPPEVVVGPECGQNWASGAFSFRLKYEPSCPSGALEVLGVREISNGRISAPALAMAFRELSRSFAEARHVSVSVLVDKEDVILELAELGFRMTAYLPAWHRDAATGQRFDAVQLVRRLGEETPVMHGTQDAIARFDGAYRQIINNLAQRSGVEVAPLCSLRAAVASA